MYNNSPERIYGMVFSDKSTPLTVKVIAVRVHEWQSQTTAAATRISQKRFKLSFSVIRSRLRLLASLACLQPPFPTQDFRAAYKTE